MRCKVLITTSVLMLVALAVALPLSAQQAAFEGVWTVKYADGSQGSMTVEKGSVRFSVPVIGELKGRVEIRTDYFESILDRRGINFIFGSPKSGGIEGKLQEDAPCPEMKKAFKSVVTEGGSSCHMAFTAVRK